MKDETVQIDVGGYPFSVEVVETPEKRARGLMGRKYLPNGTGMLFKMDGGPAQFHMKNTLIPLDILFLDAGGTVLKSDVMQPYIGRSRCAGDVQYVLELPAGTCDEVGVTPGDKLDVLGHAALRNIVREILLRK